MYEFQGANITIIIDSKAPNAKNFTLLCVIGEWDKTKSQPSADGRVAKSLYYERIIYFVIRSESILIQ